MTGESYYLDSRPSVSSKSRSKITKSGATNLLDSLENYNFEKNARVIASDISDINAQLKNINKREDLTEDDKKEMKRQLIE